jgi:hypothetical protein
MGEQHLRLARYFFADANGTWTPPEFPRSAINGRGDTQLITRHSKLFETCAIDPSQQIERILTRLGANRFASQNSSRLGDAFYQQHAGKDLLLRKVPLEKRLIRRDILDRCNASTSLDMFNVIQQQKWITMR